MMSQRVGVAGGDGRPPGGAVLLSGPGNGSVPNVPLCSCLTCMVSGFRCERPRAFYVIDEGPQFRQHLMAARIEEKNAGCHWCECLQDLHEGSGFHRPFRDRLRNLRQSNAFDGGAEYGWKIVGDERSRDNCLDRTVSVDE